MFAPPTPGADLTAEQRAAVDHDGGHLLIVAGAGTGKTTTLAARVARLVATGTAPERICLLTFSRRAAAELLERAEQRCGHDIARRAWGGTFHAVAHRLLRRHGAAIGLAPDFTVLDQADTADLLALVRAELHAHDGATPIDRRRARKELLPQILSRVVNTSTPLATVIRERFPWVTDDIDELGATFAAYVGRKRASAVLDYDDLLRCWLALLRSPAGESVRARFDHVLVDEYQDTNPLQADIVAALAGAGPGVGGGARITAVGDDAQAIYGFRAATPRNILEFPERFAADLVVLETNHRSTAQVLATANAVAADAAARHEKVLRSTRPDGPRPVLVECDDEAGQSAAVCRHVLERHAAGLPLQRQAVLVRTGHHSDLLELELTARRIPFRKFGGLRFLEAAHVKDLVCLVRLVRNPRDELAWFRVLQLLEGVGPATARRLSSGAPTVGELPAGARAEGGTLLATLDTARGLESGPAVEAVRLWLGPVHRRRVPDAEARGHDLDALVGAAGRAPSLEQFLADLTLDPPASTGELAGPPALDDDWLTISTIHSAKGAEWDVVHVLHVTDGSIPSDLATGDAEQLEEERRLLYVAVTRARDELRCYLPLRYHVGLGRSTGGDRHSYGQPSRFLSPPVLATLDRVAGQPRIASDGGNRPLAGPGSSAVLGALDDELLALFERPGA